MAGLLSRGRGGAGDGRRRGRRHRGSEGDARRLERLRGGAGAGRVPAARHERGYADFLDPFFEVYDLSSAASESSHFADVHARDVGELARERTISQSERTNSITKGAIIVRGFEWFGCSTLSSGCKMPRRLKHASRPLHPRLHVREPLDAFSVMLDFFGRLPVLHCTLDLCLTGASALIMMPWLSKKSQQASL